MIGQPPELTARTAATLKALREGELDVVGRLIGSSNNAMVVRVRPSGTTGSDEWITDSGEGNATIALGAGELLGVWKPTAGEAPLFDFPNRTLSKREVAAFLVSEATGFGIVPPTVLRDGPYGEGALQQWIEVDETVDVVELVVHADARLRRVALFDAIVNNTDRKGGHLLPIADGHIYGVDHGVTFSRDPKLRTLLWAWAGAPFEPAEVAVLEHVRADIEGDLGRELRPLLSRAEVTATLDRVDTLLAAGVFPSPNPNWPSIPWPPI